MTKKLLCEQCGRRPAVENITVQQLAVYVCRVCARRHKHAK